MTVRCLERSQLIRAATVTALAASVAWLPAQTVHQVGPGALPQIADAITIASPGDIIEVASGAYRTFTCDKALTITAAPLAQVEIYPDFGFNVPPTVFQVPPAQSARVQGLHFRSLSFIQLSEVHVLSGTVCFEGCRWTGALTVDQLLNVDSAACWLRDCELTVGNVAYDIPALRATNASIAAVDCEFHGGHLLPDGWLGAGAGIDASNTSLHLTRCDVVGGNTNIFSCFYPAGDAVRTDRGDLCWLADSQLQGGTAACNLSGGGAGLRNTSTAAVKLTRTTVIGGPGGTVVTAVIGPTAPGQLLGLANPAPEPLLAAPFQVDYLTEPNETLFVFASFELDPMLPALTQETTWVPANSYLHVAVLAADSTGAATFATAVPNAPGLRHTGIWLHAAALAASPFRVAAPVGGVLR